MKDIVSPSKEFGFYSKYMRNFDQENDVVIFQTIIKDKQLEDDLHRHVLRPIETVQYCCKDRQVDQ